MSDTLFSSLGVAPEDRVFRLRSVLTVVDPRDVVLSHGSSKIRDLSGSMGGRTFGITRDEAFSYEMDRYQFYLDDIRSRGGNPTDLLYDFTAKSMATLDYMKERARASPHNHAILFPMVKMTEVVANSLDRLHKQVEGDRRVVEHRITADLDAVLARANDRLRSKRLDDLKSSAIDVSSSPSSSSSVDSVSFDSVVVVDGSGTS